jgi:hypothetical protein
MHRCAAKKQHKQECIARCLLVHIVYLVLCVDACLSQFSPPRAMATNVDVEILSRRPRPSFSSNFILTISLANISMGDDKENYCPALRYQGMLLHSASLTRRRLQAALPVRHRDVVHLQALPRGLQPQQDLDCDSGHPNIQTSYINSQSYALQMTSVPAP